MNEQVETPNQLLTLFSHHVKTPRVMISRSILINAIPENVFHFIERIGGDNGWYTIDWLIKLRLIIKGRARLHRRKHKLLTVGDDVDFFKVAEIEKDKYLVLKFNNNMLDGVVGFYLKIIDATKTTLYVSTFFDYMNTRGKLYWFFVKPFDSYLQKLMLKNIKRMSEELRN